MLRATFPGMDTPCYVQRYAQCHSTGYRMGRYQYQMFDIIGIWYRYSRENKYHSYRSREKESVEIIYQAKVWRVIMSNLII